MNRAPTISDLASAAKVSRFTVSLALRNSPRVAAATRLKVEAVAKKLGYRPNPTLAALMRSIRSKSLEERRTCFAMIVALDEPDWKGRHRYIQEMRRGAEERAASLGYGFECLTLPKSKEPIKRLQQIIEARGIDGLIIAPLHRSGVQLGLDLARQSYVAIGQTLTEVPANRVESGTYHNMRIVLDAIRNRGWRRPGAILHQRLSAAVEDRLLGAYLAYGHALPDESTVPPLLCHEAEMTAEMVVKWVRENQVDAVIASRSQILDWLIAAGYRIGEDLGFAHLDCPSESLKLAGMDQRLCEVGAIAVEMLGEQIQANQRGIPRIPKIVEIDGVWHDGPSLPFKPSGK
jgi:DNA-binding LacI/PurR family transcriptional regulator